jgi:hypothetical protein
VQHLDSNEQEVISARGGVFVATTPDEHIVNVLMDIREIPYQEPWSALLHKLAGQVVSFVAGYVDDPDEGGAGCPPARRRLRALVYAQLKATPPRKRHALRRPRRCRASRCSAPTWWPCARGEPLHPFRDAGRRPAVPSARCSSWASSGALPRAAFPLRSRAALRDPAGGRPNGREVAQARAGSLPHPLAQHARRAPCTSPTSWWRPDRPLAGASPSATARWPTVDVARRAARRWLVRARHALTAEVHGGKPWGYLLVPSGQIREQDTLDGLIARYRCEG